MTEGNKIELLERGAAGNGQQLREGVAPEGGDSGRLITFGGRAAEEHLPLVAAHEVSAMKPLAASGPTPMGKAFDLACRLLEDKGASRRGLTDPCWCSCPGRRRMTGAAATGLCSSERGSKASCFAMAIGADADREMLRQVPEWTGDAVRGTRCPRHRCASSAR